MDEIFSNPVTLGAIGLVVLVVVAVIAFQAGKRSVTRSEADGGSGSAVSSGEKNVNVVWNETAEGPFSNAFEFQARKGMNDGQLRELLIGIVKGYDQRSLKGLILKHPAGRESQLFRFQQGKSVEGKPQLQVEYVSFTSDPRRTNLFLQGCKHEEMNCASHELFELTRKHILSYKEGGRKTCPTSNLAFRETYVAPVQTVSA